MTARTAPLALALLLAPVLAGCANPFAGDATPYVDLAGYHRDDAGEDADAWPDLQGETLTLLDNGAFTYGCPPAAQRFENLTGVKVTCENGGDAGSALKKLMDRAGDGTYDVVYGLDNALLHKANRAGLLEEYKPRLADRIDPALVFFGSDPWTATPVDHGYVAINVDPFFRNATGADPFHGAPVDTLARVRVYADHLVVEDPAQSSPGLAFLLTTIAKYGENPPYGTPYYDWRSYWADLFAGTVRPGAASPPCVLVVPDWSTAYEHHFSNGYGSPRFNQSGLGDKPLVVSYTESPAYEAYYATYPPERASQVILEDRSTWHQVQTMAIAKGTQHLQAAQAWIEYALTDHFQGLAAPMNAVYPVVPAIGTDEVYGDLDPEPGTFRPATLDYAHVGENLDRWLGEWRQLYEKWDCRS